MRFNPLFHALDTNEDGELSKREIKNAAKSLRKLDKNNDGQLTPEEFRPNFPPGGPAAGGPDGQHREGPPQTGSGADPEDMVKNLMGFDKNGDGKLSKDELPERMQGMFERGDSNKDGFLSPDEIRTMAAASKPPVVPVVQADQQDADPVAVPAASIPSSPPSTSTTTASSPRTKSTPPPPPSKLSTRTETARSPWTSSAPTSPAAMAQNAPTAPPASNN